MKKTHWLRTTLITLACCGFAGLILAVILFNANPGRTFACSSVEFSFEGAADGLAPNGYRYDLKGFRTDEVLEAALKDAGMDGKYTAEQLRDSLIISGVFPEGIVKQMTNYESFLTGDAGKITVGSYFATLYNVTLYNDFDRNISRGDLEKLLEAVMAEFRAYFARTYSVFLSEENITGDFAEYDYLQQLEILGSSIDRKTAYAAELSERLPYFLVDGASFSDIAVQFQSLESSELERLNGLVTMNALSRNPDQIIAQYENRIKTLQIRLKEKQAEAENIEALVAQYNKDDIIYVSTSGALQKVDSNSADTYDTLVTCQQEVTAAIADLNREIALMQLKLDDIRNAEKKENAKTAATGEADAETAGQDAEETADASNETKEEREAQAAAVGDAILAAKAKNEKITEDFSSFLRAYSDQEINDTTVSITRVKYNTPKLLSSDFIKLAIKTAGPLCVLGFMACLTGIIVSRRKEEKNQAGSTGK